MSISIPNSYVNPKVATVGVSKLRSLSASKLRSIDKTLVIQENDQPLAVLLKYEEYMAMQERLLSMIETHAVLSDKNVVEGIRAGRADAASGNTRPIEEIRNANNPRRKA